MKNFNFTLSTKWFLRSLIVGAVGLTSTFSAHAADTMYVNPSSTVPAANAEIPSCTGVSEIGFTIPGGGEFGIEQIFRTGMGRTIRITRDDKPFMNVNAADESLVTYSPRSVNEVIIHTGEIKEPGVYSVSIPQGLVLMAQDQGVVDDASGSDNDPTIYMNAAYTFSFTIVDMPDFSISPKPGLYQPSDLTSFTISFPDGATVTTGDSNAAIGLYRWDAYASSLTRVSEYTLVSSVNEAILQAKSPNAISPLVGSLNREWYYLLVPKNALEIQLDGKTYHNPALTFEKYDVRTVGANGFTISPYPADGLLPTDVRTFTLSYPDKYELDEKVQVGYNAAYLKQTGNSADSKLEYNGFNFGTLLVSNIDEASHTITLEMAEPITPYSYENNPALMETSYYCVSFTSRVFDKLASLNFPGYGVIGRDACPLSGLRITVKGQAQEDLNLKVSESFTGFEFFYPFAMKHSGTPKDITLTHEGTTVATISSSAISLPTGGSKYMDWKLGKTIAAAGEYILTIPAGVFRQTTFGDYLNAEQKFTITIAGEASSVEEIETTSDESAIYYTFDGRIANKNALLPGLYIVKQGNKVSKVLVK